MNAEQVLRELESALRDGWIIQLDHTVYDGFRAWKRRWNKDYEMFWPGDTLVKAIAGRLEEENP